MDSARTQPRPVALVLTAGTSIVGGAFIGASTNAVNGWVSPEYFRNIMRWDEIEQIWRASIAQGIFEGLIYGVLFAIAFTLVVGIVARGRCSYGFALQYQLGILLAIYGCWVAGGLLAMGLATLSPEFYQNTFTGVPDAFGPMLRYAWVGGSIWGAMFGGLLSGILGSVLLALHWRRLNPQTGA